MIKKRKARADTIFDYDDLLFLIRLKELTENPGNSKDKLKSPDAVGIHFDILKTKLNMSHNAFLTHLRRLSNYDFVKELKPVNSQERFKGSKINYLFITAVGKHFLELSFSFDFIKNKFNDLFLSK